jgi:hypothetical protein
LHFIQPKGEDAERAAHTAEETGGFNRAYIDRTASTATTNFKTTSRPIRVLCGLPRSTFAAHWPPAGRMKGTRNGRELLQREACKLHYEPYPRSPACLDAATITFITLRA